MNLIMNNVDNIIIILAALIILIQVFEIRRLKSSLTTFAGGVQRMSDFLLHKKMTAEYQEYSSEKYGEKRPEPTPPPPEKKYNKNGDKI